MRAKVSNCIENLFTLATRQQCMAKFKNVPVPSYGRTPAATAAVLVPLCRVDGVPSLLYTVRSPKLRTNAGQVSFPGGKTDGDETPEQTALRETHEEIGLSPSKVDIWGHGPAFPGRDFKILITPVIGSINDMQIGNLKVNKNEVSELYAVSIESLCNPSNQYYTQFSNGFILPVFVVEQFKIWGITAYITHVFLNCALPKEIYKNEWKKKRISIKE